MRNFLLLIALTPLVAFSQTKTSVANGDFYNPLTWDCLCFPASGDDVVINHDISMNTGIYYTSGTITINPSGSLTDNGQDRDIWVDGSGRLINHGDVSVRYFATSQFTYIENSGNFIGIDSMLTRGVFNNIGSIQVYDYLNDHMSNFANYGSMDIQNNMNNQGNFDNWSTMDIGLDFSNCNTQSLHGEFTNYGTVCIARNFLNCDGDEMNGTGHYYIGDLSSNLGLFSGTFTFHTPTGSMTIPGTISSGVTVTSGSCALELAANNSIEFKLFPNPTRDVLYISESSIEYRIIDLNGQVILDGITSQNGTDVSSLESGMYIIQLKDKGSMRFQKF